MFGVFVHVCASSTGGVIQQRGRAAGGGREEGGGKGGGESIERLYLDSVQELGMAGQKLTVLLSIQIVLLH